MADINNNQEPHGLDEFLANDDPRAAYAAQGMQQIGRAVGNAAIGAIDDGAYPRVPIDPRQEEPGLLAPLIDPIDVVGGAI